MAGPGDPSEFPQRKQLRLKGYDYALGGAYFVTICVDRMRALLGKVRDGKVELNSIGQLVEGLWLELPDRYAGVVLDAHVIMPNHIHGIVGLIDPTLLHHSDVGAGPRARPQPRLSLIELVKRYKSLTTNRYHKQRQAAGALHLPTRLWQRSFWDRVIRDQTELHFVQEYIVSNPLSWELEQNRHPEWPFTTE
jgi:REP element-mobilizing transposase RayT